jgi:hypothetical protein
MSKRLFVLLLVFFCYGGCVSSNKVTPAAVSEFTTIEFVTFEKKPEVTIAKIDKNPVPESKFIKISYDSVQFGVYAVDDNIYLPRKDSRKHIIVLFFLDNNGKVVAKKTINF